MLQQLSYHCPGLHGPGSRQTIERRTFAQFLYNEKRLIIPLFQRRYCWQTQQWENWWEDMRRGKRDHLGLHNTGNIVVKHQENSIIIVDGQQRATTTMLCLAAIKEALMCFLAEPTTAQLVDELDSYLYMDKQHSKSRLLPSYLDRNSYLNMINGKVSTGQTWQEKAREFFDKAIQKELADLQLDTDKVHLLGQIQSQALHKMSLTRVVVENPVNLAQIFLWLQEKSMFGEAALLYNPTPGEAFRASDMVRNLMLASVVDQPMEWQEQFYQDKWINGIENKSGGEDPKELNVKILAFVHSHCLDNNEVRHKSQMEKTVDKLTKGKGSNQFVDIKGYAKFYSIFENKLRHKLMLPPDEQDFLTKVTADTIYDASTELLHELSQWL